MSYPSHKPFEDKQDRDPQGARSYYISRARNVNEKQVFVFPLEIELNAQHLLSLMAKTDDSRRAIENLGMTLDDGESTPNNKRKYIGIMERKRKKKQPPQKQPPQDQQQDVFEDICDKNDGELLRGSTPTTCSSTKELSCCGSSSYPPKNYSFVTENKSHESFRRQEQGWSSPKQSRPPSIIEFPVFDSFSITPVGGAPPQTAPAARRRKQASSLEEDGDDDEEADEQIWQPLPITCCGRSGLQLPCVPKTPSYLKMAGELIDLFSE